MSAQTPRNEEIEKAAAHWVFRRETGLSPEEQAEFERWLENDPRHGAALDRHEHAWAVLDRPRAAGQADLLLQRLAARKLRRRRIRIAGIGLVAVVACVVGFQIDRTHKPDPANTVAVVLPETRLLEDGSVVELKSGARLAVNFSETLRRVELEEGEAHFKVAHRPGRPFLVVVDTVEFRAVGTAFNVKLADAGIELLVTEGSVAIEKASAGPPDDFSPAIPLPKTLLTTVSAGNHIVVKPANEEVLTTTMVPPKEVSELLAWRAPRLEFTETPLALAIEMMNRHNRAQLVIEDDELGKLLVSGLFRADRLEAFVLLLETNFGVSAEQKEDVTFLRRKR